MHSSVQPKRVQYIGEVIVRIKLNNANVIAIWMLCLASFVVDVKLLAAVKSGVVRQSFMGQSVVVLDASLDSRCASVVSRSSSVTHSKP